MKTTTDNRIATNEEAIAGTDDIKLMTPLKTLNSISNYMNGEFMTDSIFKYNELKSYGKGDLCFCINEEFIPKIYYSIVNNNLGNNPLADENNDYWEEIKTGSSSFVGQLIKSTIPLNDANLHLADGSTLTYNGIYKDFYDYMLTLYNSETVQPYVFCTLEEYNQNIATYGICGKYVLVENEYIKLPTINGWIETTTDINNNGISNEAGLPNITGTFQGTRSAAAASYVEPSGAFKRLLPGLDTYNAGAGDCYNTEFNASYSNAIYGKSTTVQLKGIKYLVYIVLGTTKNTEVDINNVINDINVINTNINNINNNITDLQQSYLIESYTDGNGSWYRKYSDGWCEQGAFLPNTGGADIVFNLLVPFKDTNYFIVKNCGSPHTDTPAYRSVSCYALTTTTFQHTSNTSQIDARYYACGYYK